VPDPAHWRELRAYCRGVRAGQHDARAALVMVEAVRIETLVDVALERLGVKERERLAIVGERRGAAWERRLVHAMRVRVLLIRSLRRHRAP